MISQIGRHIFGSSVKLARGTSGGSQELALARHQADQKLRIPRAPDVRFVLRKVREIIPERREFLNDMLAGQ